MTITTTASSKPRSKTVTRAALGADVAAAVKTAMRRGRLFAAIGDSLTASNGAFNAYPGGGWWGMLQIASGGRIQPHGWAAQSGQTTLWMLNNAIPMVAAIDPKPDYCFVLAGTNDVNQNVAYATSVANLAAIYDALDAMGIGVIPVTIPPLNDGDHTRETKLNAWIKAASRKRGYPSFDLYALMVEPGTGQYKTNYNVSGDPIHMTTASHWVVAQAMATALLPLTSPSVLLPTSKSDGANLITNGVFVGDSNSDGVADGWTKTGGTATATLEAGTGDVLGNWQKVSISAAGNNYINQTITTGFATDDLMLFTGRIKITSITAGFNVIARVSTGTVANAIAQAIYGYKTVSEGVFARTFRVPASTANLIPVITGNNTSGDYGDWAVAQVGLYNLTALGIA